MLEAAWLRTTFRIQTPPPDLTRRVWILSYQPREQNLRHSHLFAISGKHSGGGLGADWNALLWQILCLWQAQKKQVLFIRSGFKILAVATARASKHSAFRRVRRFFAPTVASGPQLPMTTPRVAAVQRPESRRAVILFNLKNFG